MSIRKKKHVIVIGDFGIVPLTKGRVSLIDRAYVDLASKHNWYFVDIGSGYAATRLSKTRMIYLHRLILGCSDDGLVVDHKNGDSLDNRAVNIRQCTQTQNMGNIRKQSRVCSSIHKGVVFDKSRRLWRARIVYSKNEIYIGRYKTEEEARVAYNYAAEKYFGEFARLN